MLFEQISEPCMSQILQGIDCKRKVTVTNQEMCFEPNVDFNTSRKIAKTTTTTIPKTQITKEPIETAKEEGKTPLMNNIENNPKRRLLTIFFKKDRK